MTITHGAIVSVPPSVSRLLAAVPWPWLSALAVVTLLSLGAYGGLQQVLRSDANDPQVQLAEDAAARLAAGAQPDALLPAGHVDLSSSLSPWVAVARIGSGVVATNGDLQGRPPSPPAGVLTTAVRDGGNRVTWQPTPHLRVALVVVPVEGRPDLVVMAGRSMREVEERVDRIGRLVLLAWMAAACAVLSAWGLTAWGRSSARTA